MLPNVKYKLKTSECLDSIRTRFYEVSKLGDTLEPNARDSLLERWSGRLEELLEELVGASLSDWLHSNMGYDWCID